MTENYVQLLTKYWHKIDPLDITSYIKKGGYEALKKAIREMEPQDVINEVKTSKLYGRGGAGYPAGEKWEIVAGQKEKERYFICNLDESEPGTYKDRAIAFNNPHQIIEGVAIGAYAVKAKQAFIYLNGGYKREYEILENAIKQAYEKEFLGKGITGSSIDIDLELFQGAGGYICGEETALIHSMEGFRGEPKPKAFYPTEKGYLDKPTVINNAETMANVPWIIKNGGQKYSQIGSLVSPGTKLFVLEGQINIGGVTEVPLGTTLRELIFTYGGGLKRGKEFWFAQIGGSSGKLALEKDLDTALVYSKENPFPIGCGSILVVDKSVDIRDMLLSWADFFHRESCGQCVPCREGTYQLWQIARRLADGKISPRDKANIDDILWVLNKTSFCPFGPLAATAWRNAMDNFSKEIF